jgi:DNA polymerase III subunit beta
MKINTNRETLIKGIQTIQAGVSSKTTTIPILQNFLMETEDKGVRVTFTDLEMAVKHYIPVNIKAEGSITVPIKKFMEIVHNLGDAAEVNITADEGNRISILSGKARFKMGGAPKNDYPVTPDIDESDSFKVPAKTLAEMINNTIFSASTEDDRHFLNGLLWKNEKDSFSLVATDGRRLAIATSKKIKAKKDFKVIVPSKILGELARFIKGAGLEDKDEVTVGLSSNQIGFKVGRTVFISRLIEGNFPAYEQIIPKSHELEVTADTQALMGITKRAAVCSNERAGSVKFTFREGAIVVNSASQSMDLEDEIPADYRGKDFSISFNPKFVIDILKVTPEKEVTAQFTTPATPALIRPKGREDLAYIVMPLRTQ